MGEHESYRATAASAPSVQPVAEANVRMRVLLDDQAFLYQRHGGVARYFAELIRQFRTTFASSVDVETPFRYVRSLHLAEIDSGRYRAVQLPDRLLHGRGAVGLRLANTLRYRGRSPSDILHHTFYLPGRLGGGEIPQVCTVHDMIPELFPDPSLDSQAAGKRAYVDACDGILFVSETTRRDCLRIYGDQGKPTAVTPHGVTDVFFRRARTKAPFPGPYALFVGQRHTYKNFPVLLQAMSQLPGPHRELKLACAGGTPFSEDEQALIQELGLGGRVIQAGLGDQTLAAAYQGATCFVSPSSIEGFGIPVLEAAASGCPALLADTPIFREVGGEPALFFPPDKPAVLAEHLANLIGDRARRAELGAAAQLRSQSYTWERTAQGSLALYQEVLANH